LSTFNNGQKIPLSTSEAGFIYCADSFSILIQGLKDECILFKIKLIVAKPPEKSRNTQRIEQLKAEG